MLVVIILWLNSTQHGPKYDINKVSSGCMQMVITIYIYLYFSALNCVEIATSGLVYASGVSYYQKLNGSTGDFTYWNQMCTG